MSDALEGHASLADWGVNSVSMSRQALRRPVVHADSDTGLVMSLVPEPASPAAEFGARLRAQREKRNVSIATIAESTKILPALLEGLENGDVTRWPTGLYRRSFLRSYADGIGLDPETVVRDFLQHFPDAEDTPPTPVAAVTPAPAAVVSRSALRLTFPDSGSPRGRLTSELGWRAAAVAADAFAIIVAGVLLFTAVGSLWAPLCIAGALYFFGSVLLFGATPGVVLFSGPSRSRPRRLAGPRARPTPHP